jgi:membrane protein implicated in regulation of membrane protease activity
MTWANFYLVCFLVGFLLSLLSLMLGSLHTSFHLSHGGGHGLHFHVGHGAGDLGGHAAGQGVHVGHGGESLVEHAGETALSPLNFGTIAAFLAWFGGSGYLFTRYSRFWSLVGLGLAVVVGLVGAGIVFMFLLKLASHEENLDPQDYDMVGVIGHISSGIRRGGTGEIVYSQEGTRHTCGARSEDGTEVPKGTEIVVTRYEKGIAYVRRWDEISGEDT